MHVRPLLCESSTVLFDRSNVSVNVRPYADCAGRPTKCGFSHTYVYEVALGGSVHETGIRWDVHTFPLVGHTQKL